MKLEQAILANGGLGPAITQAAAFVAPMSFAPAPPADEKATNNGTMFFLDCGRGLFAVTAHHVYQAYRRRKKADPNVVCRIGTVAFAPEERLIALDSEWDIATFHMEAKELASIGAAVHYPEAWPPAPPRPGQGVLFAGFPSVRRRLNGAGEIEFRALTAASVAASVNDRQVVCRLGPGIPADAFGSARPKVSLGGLSGAPLWAVDDRGGDLRLAGIVASFNRGWDLLYAKHAHYIRADGTLIRRLIPRLPTI